VGIANVHKHHVQGIVLRKIGFVDAVGNGGGGELVDELQAVKTRDLRGIQKSCGGGGGGGTSQTRKRQGVSQKLVLPPGGGTLGGEKKNTTRTSPLCRGEEARNGDGDVLDLGPEVALGNVLELYQHHGCHFLGRKGDLLTVVVDLHTTTQRMVRI
jgi:hypothetical protein